MFFDLANHANKQTFYLNFSWKCLGDYIKVTIMDYYMVYSDLNIYPTLASFSFIANIVKTTIPVVPAATLRPSLTCPAGYYITGFRYQYILINSLLRFQRSVNAQLYVTAPLAQTTGVQVMQIMCTSLYIKDQYKFTISNDNVIANRPWTEWYTVNAVIGQ